MYKYSIDVNLKLGYISGWFDCADEHTVVELYHRGVKVASTGCLRSRPDVMVAGLHSTGDCGFSFSKGDYLIEDGCVYKVVIVFGDQRLSALRVYGDFKKLQEEFFVYELLPRHEYKYLAETTEEVLSNRSDTLGFKSLLIRLRRGKRGVSWRGEFKGVEYPHKYSDFVSFKSVFEGQLEFWLRFLDARYLWSVIDTYADYGSVLERLAALSVSNYMFSERFFQTRKCIFDSVEKVEVDKVLVGQINYWGGMKTNQIIEDDSMDVFFTRNLEILKDIPVIQSVFFELIKRAAVEEESGLGFNLKFSDYFAKVFDFYRKERF